MPYGDDYGNDYNHYGRMYGCLVCSNTPARHNGLCARHHRIEKMVAEINKDHQD